MSLPPILTSAQLLAELNAGGQVMTRSTLWKRATRSAVWRSCQVESGSRTTEWSRQRLINAGILMAPAPVAEVIEGPRLAFSFKAQVVA